MKNLLRMVAVSTGLQATTIVPTMGGTADEIIVATIVETIKVGTIETTTIQTGWDPMTLVLFMVVHTHGGTASQMPSETTLGTRIQPTTTMVTVTTTVETADTIYAPITPTETKDNSITTTWSEQQNNRRLTMAVMMRRTMEITMNASNATTVIPIVEKVNFSLPSKQSRMNRSTRKDPHQRTSYNHNAATRIE